MAVGVAIRLGNAVPMLTRSVTAGVALSVVDGPARMASACHSPADKENCATVLEPREQQNMHLYRRVQTQPHYASSAKHRLQRQPTGRQDA